MAHAVSCFMSCRVRWVSRTSIVACVLVVALAGCAPFVSPASPATSPDQRLGLAQGTPGTGVAPVGWRRLLNGQSFTDSSAENGLAVSLTLPVQLAACALPNTGADGRPVFLLSEDGGRTWRSRVIPGVGADWQTCLVLADAQLANAFALEVNDPDGPNGNVSQVELTANAGQTWRVVQAPPGEQIAIYGHGETTLVNGTLYADLRSSSLTQEEFARLTPDGAWHSLDASLPYLHATLGQNQTPDSVTVDPSDANHVLIAQPTTHGVAAFLSADAGVTWREVYRWPSSLVVALWSGPKDQFYAQDVIHNVPTATQFFYSADGGASWVSSGLHAKGGYSNADQVFVSPAGRVLTAWNGQFFSLNPTTGVFAAVGAAPTFDGGVFTCVIVEGADPTLICAGRSDTFARSLPSIG